MRRCSDEERRLQHADWFDDYSGTSDGEGKRVALLFFGLPRSMPYTIPHIQKNVIQVIKDAGYRCATPKYLCRVAYGRKQVFCSCFPETTLFGSD